MTAAIVVRGLVAGHGGVPAVRGIELDVQPGELVTMLGPNGAGKSTTLLTIAGALRPISGSVEIFGHDVTHRSAHQVASLGLALVPQDRGIFFQLTVDENLRLRRRHRSGHGTPQIFELFPQFEGLRSRRAGLLSGGEQQMLALGCALLAEPRALMVDEMSHGLAPVIVAHLLPMLRVIADRSGTAVLFVEQHVTAALRVADRAYVLNRGLVSLEGDAASIRANPELVEASYLGDVDAVDGKEPVHA